MDRGRGYGERGAGSRESGEGKWGERGREAGREGEGSRERGGGKWREKGREVGREGERSMDWIPPCPPALCRDIGI